MNLKNVKPNFDWDLFKVHQALTNRDIAEILGMDASNIGRYIRVLYVTVNIKRKLETVYGREFLNQFLIKDYLVGGLS